MPGSRAGGQIATTWGILVYNGLNFYKNMATKIINVTRNLVKNINSLQKFKVIGNPMVNVVAFNSDTYSLGQIIEEFQKQGWNLNIMQNPLCLHICITPYNIDKINEIVNILKIITSKEVENKDEGLVSIYGMAEKIPDRTIIHEIIEQYLDLTTNLK